MNTYSIADITNSMDRHKLYAFYCNPGELNKSVSYIQKQKIKTVNVGKELAIFIDKLDDYKYLNIDVYDFTKRLLDNCKAKVNGSANEVIAVYNLGILLEPTLELNVNKFLKDYSKSTVLIIIWENHKNDQDILNWPTQMNKYFLDLSDTQLKEIQYAI